MWYPNTAKRYDAQVNEDGLTAGEFMPVSATRVHEKQKVLPRLTVRKTGACSINNGFFKDTNINPNNTMEFQADERLSMVRFRFGHPTPLLPIAVNQGDFNVRRDEAVTILHYANQTVNCCVANAKVEFVIVRQDKLGWWYAKASGYRYDIPQPRTFDRLTSAERALWNLPHSFLIDPLVTEELPPPPPLPTPPPTRCIVNGRDINKK